MRIMKMLKILIMIASISFHTSRYSKKKILDEAKVGTDCTYIRDFGKVLDKCGEGLICVTADYNTKDKWFTEYIEAKGICLKISETENIPCTEDRECASFYCVDNFCKPFSDNADTHQSKIKSGEKCFKKFQCQNGLECNGDICGEHSDNVANTNIPNDYTTNIHKRGDTNDIRKFKFKKLKF